MNLIYDLTLRNLMSGNGFTGGAFSGQWISAWIALGILFIIIFLTYILQKNDSIPIPYSIPGSLIGVFVTIIIITFFGWVKIGFILGVVGTILGGWLVGNYSQG